MITVILSRFIILIFGTLYPAYASYKAVRHKDVKEYLKWIMYWIVFAFFTCCETFTDVFLSWFPFYYELKVAIVIWLLSPITEGSSVLYRNFVHPMLTKREKEIDEYINQAKEKGCSAVIQLGSKGVNYATSVIMQTALKNSNLLRITNGEASTSRGRDEIDYNFSEVEEFMLEEEMQIDQHSERSSRTPFDEDDDGVNDDNSSDGDYVAEVTESFDEDNDDFDRIVTRGQSKRQTAKAKKDKEKKPKKSPVSRQNRTTRAASVRF
ncbi:receptor expression-enhancing protein 1 isoform X9 [Sitodiplosis mosellana]|uniref:receptor expression-enhancing protein 1 isoform X9 n=1 Tax=Sitodiplosis mosellana TaxID=263140 RepID=UPI002443AC63|nr:receptor expression-enhancing protein 1 isoform X9 [Sitodiplosis mosellana]XP_055327119.1 receptor expression-enhancing protein 1 isoform X9 [Sitodiplosis mosellana]XP_055327120.1 receptor expression-enhancing protein 1 isoform X9 [Sitodiplosis mosellana]